jgi:hypothetical protein
MLVSDDDSVFQTLCESKYRYRTYPVPTLRKQTRSKS